MNEFLDPLWAAFDADAPMFDSDYVAAWPDGALDWLLKTKLVGRAATATHVVCPGCHERHVEEVQSVEMPDGTRRFYVTCPEVMRAWVPDSLLERYQPDFAVLARLLKEGLEIDGRVRERLTNRLWRIGECNVARARREVFLARGLSGMQGIEVIEAVPRTGKPIVLMGGVAPSIDRLPASMTAMIPLPGFISARVDGIVIDGARLITLVAECDELIKTRGGNREELRTWIVSVVERAIQEGPSLGVIAQGVKAGKTTREIAADMKKRGLSKHHSTVARKIKKAKGSYGGTGVRSSSSVLRSHSSQPRDRHGGTIYEAQPEGEE